MVLLHDEQRARDYATGPLKILMCPRCGFSWNDLFDIGLVDYSDNYVSSQFHSGKFSSALTKIIEDLVDRYGLRHGRVLEIGCGQGEFLSLICDIGENEGIGYDPVYAGRYPTSPRARFVTEIFDETTEIPSVDLVCCRMTLEHIQAVDRFATMLRRALAAQPQALVYIEVPNAGAALEELNFREYFYEHCSYFTDESLRSLFSIAGFTVLDVRSEFGDQILILEARPDAEPMPRSAEQGTTDRAPDSRFRAQGERFRTAIDTLIQDWQRQLAAFQSAGQRGALWGGGAKAVAFLSAVGRTGDIRHVVDLNPSKHGTFLPGGAQRVIAPDDLMALQPDYCIVTNAIYRDEIAEQIAAMGLSLPLYTTETVPETAS